MDGQLVEADCVFRFAFFGFFLVLSVKKRGQVLRNSNGVELTELHKGNERRECWD